MKRLFLFFAALCGYMAVSAQEVTTAATDTLVLSAPPAEMVGDVASEPMTEVVSDLQSYYEPLSACEMFATYRNAEALHLPVMDSHGHVMRMGGWPYYWGGWHAWDLHQGLNVSLGASVFGFFGKNSPSGTGFGQNISMMYAMPLSDRLSLAIGGYFSNLTWARSSYQNAGISAVLGYRFDEHWEAYIYAQKSLVRGDRYPLPLYDISDIGDRIGAAVRYNFSPSFWMQVSVEAVNYDNPTHFHHPVEKFEYKRKP